MDQVKKALAIAKEQHFWIVSGLAVLLVLGTWLTVTSSLQSEEDAKRKEIDGKFGQANTVKGKQNHVNETTHSQMDILVEQKSIDVARAWKAQYEDQKNILVWPEDLEDDFISQVNRFRPIETFPFPPETTQEILIRFRERYRDYIKSELPKLAEIIRADWAASDTGGSGDGSGAPGGMGMTGMGMGGGMGMGMGMGMGGGSSGMGGGMPGGFGGASGGSSGNLATRKSKSVVVDWAAEDQTRLQNTRFDWRSQTNKAPNTLQVLYAQEDLWVMQEIMRIIRKTNGDVEERERAAIKKIDFIRIGVDAGGQSGSVTRPQSNTGMGAMGSMAMGGSSGSSGGGGAAAGAAMAAAMSGMSGMSGSSGGSSGSSGAGAAGASGAPDPGDNRYVDNNLQPIAASKIRTALKSTAKSSDEAFFVVAKRMPVRMRVTMDQRQVNRLLAECGNASLPIEIRQVRINREAGMSGGGGGGMSGMGMGGMSGGMPSMGAGMGGGAMGGGMGMSGGMGMGGMGMGGSGDGSSGMGSGMGMGMGADGSGGGIAGRSFDSSPFDVPVEFLGIVYIYNPVDIGKLGLDASKAGALNEGSTTPPPAPTNPATAEGNVNPAATRAGG